jgi:DNA-binding NarL/FixJ family response regulator
VTGKAGPTPIRVMVVADQPVFVSLMEASLARQPDLEVVAQAGSLTEARRNASEVSFDVAVLDLGLPDGNGADLISDLRGSNPGVAVLIVSGSLDPASLERAAEAGANEIMDKFAPLEDILGTVRRLGTA